MNRRDFLSRRKRARHAANVRWTSYRERLEARRNADAKWIAEGGFVRAINQFCDDLRKADLFRSTVLFDALKASKPFTPRKTR